MPPPRLGDRMHLPGFSKRLRTSDTMIRKSGRVPVPGGPLGQVVLGKYHLAQLIGEGSNGEVYLAYADGRPDRPVVVKRVKDQIVHTPKFRQFFDGEVRSMARFRHPYAVQLFDASLDDPIGPCLVLEYVQGITLEAVIRHYGRLPADHAARILGPFCHALQAAHDAGIMHRDVKPANVMVTGLGTPQQAVKVMDFGFAGFTEKPHVQLAELTGHGPIFACGTPAYVSPEMVRADPVDARADVYGVAVVAYEMLTGRLPFEYPTVEEILAAHVKESPPKFTRIGITDVPPAVEAVVNISLSKFANERHQTAREFAEHLGQAVGWDVWRETAPPGYEPTPAPRAGADEDALLLTPAPPESPEERFALFDQFEAMLSPRMAAAKLRGFVDDVGGNVVESEPGVIVMRVGVPAGYKEPSSRSGLFNWLANGRRTPPGQEPVEVRMQMHKLDANRVQVVASFQPLRGCLPADGRMWKARCEQLNDILRMYLMASGQSALA